MVLAGWAVEAFEPPQAMLDRADELVEAIRPQSGSDNRRHSVHAYVQDLISRTFHPEKVRKACRAADSCCSRFKPHH